MAQRHTYGGQAVIEGVMIRGRHHMSVAVRRPDSTIARLCRPLSPVYTGLLRRLFLIRGVIALAETLTLGMQALIYSANVAAEAEGEELGRGAVAGMIAISLTIAIVVFFIGPVLVSRSLEQAVGSDLAANAIEGVIRLAAFIGYLALIGRMSDIRRVFMYHGAEHMTVHARERGEPLEVDAVRRYSPEHPRCGTAFLLMVIVVAVIAFVFVGRDPLWWLIASRVVLIPFIAAASYELIRLSGRHQDNPLVRIVTGPSLALQKMTTRQPDDDQIKVAIEAMTLAIQADEEEEPATVPA